MPGDMRLLPLSALAAAAEIEGRLLANGVDTDAINLDVFDQGHELLLLFNTPLNAAQNRRIMLLRKIEGR